MQKKTSLPQTFHPKKNPIDNISTKGYLQKTSTKKNWK